VGDAKLGKPHHKGVHVQAEIEPKEKKIAGGRQREPKREGGEKREESQGEKDGGRLARFPCLPWGLGLLNYLKKKPSVGEGRELLRKGISNKETKSVLK